MPNMSNLIFEGTMLSGHSSSADSEEMIVKSKAKSLSIMTFHFQSMFNKKDEIYHFLNDNNIDNILGGKTHLFPSVSASELLPPVYTAYRCETDNGYGGSIITEKKNLIIKKQKLSPEVFFKKRCSSKFRKTHRKKPVPESLF